MEKKDQNFFHRISEKVNKTIYAFTLAMRRNDTPLYAKIAAGVCVFYALSPIDLIPDFIPVLGYLDDLIILPVLSWIAVRLIPKDIMEECTSQAEDIWQEGLQTRFRYALPVIIIWCLLAYWLITRLIRLIP